MERGSLRREDGSRSREAERGNLGRGDQRDPRGDSRDPRGNSRDSRGDSRRQEWGRGGTESRDRSSSSVSTKVESGVGENKEVWEAPMPGEWQATEESGVPSWDRTVLKEEENPPDWVEPPQPKVDLSLSPYKEKFEAETAFPPVTPIENKEELLRADHIPEDDPVVVEFARGYVRTTRRGLRESKRAREEEEREVHQMLTERGFFGGREQMELWMKSFVRGEIAKAKATRIPECPVCFQQLKPPKKIVQCLKGHKICESCSENETVVSCPMCKTAFMGRDYGMEAFIRELSGEN